MPISKKAVIANDISRIMDLLVVLAIFYVGVRLMTAVYRVRVSGYRVSRFYNWMLVFVYLFPFI